MTCNTHQEEYDNISPEVINAVQTYQIEIENLANIIGPIIGPHIFKVSKIDPNEESPEDYDQIPEVTQEQLPPAIQRINNLAGLVYALGFISGEASSSDNLDEILSFIFANGINDGNAFVCVNKRKGN